MVGDDDYYPRESCPTLIGDGDYHQQELNNSRERWRLSLEQWSLSPVRVVSRVIWLEMRVRNYYGKKFCYMLNFNYDFMKAII